MALKFSEVLSQVTSETDEKFKTTVVKKPLDVDLDLGNLLAIDTNPIEQRKLKKHNREALLLSLSRDNVQILLNNLWELPVERVEDAIVVTLPEPSTEIPREKPIPKPRPDTKWEQFAKLKGIQNKKKEKMVWDKVTGTYKPAWGYKRANDETKEWCIEVPANADPFEDQFEKRIEARKERVAKNELQRLRNVEKSARKKGQAVASSELIPQEKPTSERLAKQLEIAKSSTASAGVFTNALRKEKEVKKPRGKKRKFESNTQDISLEKNKQLEMLEKLGSKEPKLNTKVAMRKVRQEEQNYQVANKTYKSKAMRRKQEAILAGKKGKKKSMPNRKRGKKR